MALGVTTCTATIYEAFLSNDKFKTLFHGHSFTANPLACVAALASLGLLLTPETQASIERISTRHLAFTHRLRQHKTVENIRQWGTILAFDLKVAGEDSSYFNSIRDIAYNHLLDRGILMRPLGNVLYFLPPYCTTNEQLDDAYGAVLDLVSTLG